MSQKKMIKEGDHIVMKRDDTYRVMEVRSKRHMFIDKHKFTLDGVIGHPYGSRFEVRNNAIIKVDAGASKIDIPACGKGVDNRNIVGKDSNQQLSHEEILAMKKDGLTGESIVGRLIENSSTFSLKTKYAQDKYIKKKKRKHMPIFIILRPTTRLLVEMYFAKSPAKICHLRVDTLAQILMLGNIRANTNVAVVDTCLGLVVGAVMERLGGHGNVIHVYHGQHPSRPAVDCYDFDQEHIDTLHSFPMDKLNLLKKTGNILTDDMKSIPNEDSSEKNEPIEKVRKTDGPMADTTDTECNQTTTQTTTCGVTDPVNSSVPKSNSTNKDLTMETESNEANGNKDDQNNLETSDPQEKNMTSPEKQTAETNDTTTTAAATTTTTDTNKTSLPGEKQNELDDESIESAKPDKRRFRGTFEDREAKREVEAKRLAMSQNLLVSKKLDCVIVASKFYPTPLVLNLLRYLSPSRQLVVYSQYKESLLECYAELREVGGLVNFRMMETWLREYQVLPMRTHPLVNMSGTGGYLLVATTVSKS